MSVNLEIKEGDAASNLAESKPMLQSVGFGHCLVCNQTVADRLELSTADFDEYLKCVCVVVGIHVSGLGAILEKFHHFYDYTGFCDKCQAHLKRFQDIQQEISTLRLVLAQLKENVCKDLLVDDKTETRTSKLRTCLLNESKLRKRTTKNEIITGDFDCNSDDYGHFHFPEACDDELDVPSNDAETDVKDMKPCQVTLFRIEDVEVSGSENERRKRKLRLKKLLKRHGSKLHGTFHGQRRILDEKEEAKRPRKQHQMSQRNFKCTADPNCQRCCLTEEMLRFHVRRIHERRSAVYNCSSCEAEFGTLKELRIHEKESGHTTPGTEALEIQCGGCRLLFKSQKRFDAHLERQGGNCTRAKTLPLNSVFDRSQRKSQRYICGECGRKYRSPHHLSIHIRGTHTEGFAFLCEFCCKPFKRKQSLSAHQRKVHPEETVASQQNTEAAMERIKSLTCEICRITFTALSSKRKHIARTHDKNFKFSCEVCGSGWVCKAELEKHMVTHKDEKNFPCTHCEMKFKALDKLNRHVQIKHGDGTAKKFSCKHCQKKFFDKTALQRHVTLMHESHDEPGARKFRCEICSYSCVIKDYLTIHGRTKKHLRKVADLGLSDANAGLIFNNVSHISTLSDFKME